MLSITGFVTYSCDVRWIMVRPFLEIRVYYQKHIVALSVGIGVDIIRRVLVMLPVLFMIVPVENVRQHSVLNLMTS